MKTRNETVLKFVTEWSDDGPVDVEAFKVALGVVLAAERERCALECEELGKSLRDELPDNQQAVAYDCAERIRGLA